MKAFSFLLLSFQSVSFLGIHAFSIVKAPVFCGNNRVIRKATTLETDEIVVSVSSEPPSWDKLNELLKEATPTDTEQALVTLYRDLNGWCPFCERVWVALRAKKIPYKEQLISLQNKPEWYKALVPTTLVPAVLFHGDENIPERKIVWESLDIMKALDEDFPDHLPKLIQEDLPEFNEAKEMMDQMSSAGFAYIYSSRNESLTESDREELRVKFVQELDKLDDALSKAGPFRLGGEFSGMDALMVPMLERWRYQLPITAGMDILENRPHIQAWFEAMDKFEPYSNRVAGDAYSWTATNAMFLRYFGGGDEKPEVVAAIERSETLSQQLTSSFANSAIDETFALEAATKLITNHEAVVQDCTNADPKSQKDVARATNTELADYMLRYVSNVLLSSQPAEQAAIAPLMAMESTDDMKEAAVAARTVSARLCVPRDMGAPAAQLLRKVLTVVADRLDGSN